MARARNIKPGLYKNEDLAECSIWARFIFPGLWMLADREGRLEDRPKRIKVELLPFDSVEVGPLLDELAGFGFILRYQAEGQRFIQICKFAEHQAPHVREQASTIPAPPNMEQSTAKVVPSTDLGNDMSSPRSPDSLIPDSLSSDSGFTDSPIPDSLKPPKSNIVALAVPANAGEIEDGKASKGKATPGTGKAWAAYATAYFDRYGVAPVRNAMVNGQMSNLVARIGPDDAASVAAFFVGHNNAYYVREMHAVGVMLKDAEKLRTEWATGARMTQTKALQADKTATNADAFAPLIAEARAREEAERNAHV